MDKEMYGSIKAFVKPILQAGIPLENIIEAVRASALDVKEERKLAELAEDHKALGSMEEADAAGGITGRR